MCIRDSINRKWTSILYMTIKVDHEIITDLVKASLFVQTIYIPVAYTHLDVYKRQSQHFFTAQQEACGI